MRERAGSSPVVRTSLFLGAAMRRLCEFISKTPLFAGLPDEVYLDFCHRANSISYNKGDLVAREGDDCPGIGLILEGQLAKQKYSPSGVYSTLDLLGSGEIFGEELIFSGHRRYPTSLEAVSASKVLFINYESLLEMFAKSPQMITNFLCLLSDRLHMHNQRIYVLSQRTLRNKVSCYLLELLREQLATDNQTLEQASKIISTQAIELPASKEVIARLLAMPRPSFSRELISMERDGLIKVSGRVIWLVNLQALESGLTEDYA